MFNYSVLICTLLMASPIWGASSSTTPADETSQQASSNEASTTHSECQISQDTIDAIKTAETAVARDGSNNVEALELIDQAEVAARQPECDSVRAKILADKAMRLLGVEAKPSSDTVYFRDCRFPQWPKKIMDFSGGADEIGFTTVIITLPTALVASAVYGAAKTSGTSGCEGDIAYRKIRQYRYVVITQDKLARDMARGGGEYVSAMAYLEGCPVETHESFAQMTKRNFSRLFSRPESDPKAILSNLETLIAADPLLAETCSAIS